MPRWWVHCVAVADGRHGEHCGRSPSVVGIAAMYRRISPAIVR
jgi:hypothetical protein